MGKTLLEYSDWLSERDLRWPAPPKPDPISATASVAPLDGIRVVTWNIYGTLLRITDGDLLFQPAQRIRLEVAIEKTIQEFNMWNSMIRRPGKPSDYFLPKYLNAVQEEPLTSGNRKGDIPEVNAAQIWMNMVGLLARKDYSYDESFYGDLEEYVQKIAYFFHASMQGVNAAPNALSILTSIADAGLRQAAFANAQSFTLVQLTQALRAQGTMHDVTDLFSDALNVLSYEWGIRKPSVSLYAQMILRLKELEIEPNQVLHVGTRIQDDLAVAKSCGFRTVLYAAEKMSLQATAEDLKNTVTRPDRMITNLIQLRDILQI